VINNCLVKDFLLFLSEAAQKSVKIFSQVFMNWWKLNCLNVVPFWKQEHSTRMKLTENELQYGKVDSNKLFLFLFLFYFIKAGLLFTNFGILDLYVRNSYWFVLYWN